MNFWGACCVLCHRQLAIARHGLCSCCNKQIRRFHYCGCCGTELARDELHCGHCLQNEPAWQRMVIVGRYNEPLSVLIHRFKFQNLWFLDRTLARLLLLAVLQARRTHSLSLPDVILAVPLHHRRHWRRGYNQTQLLVDQLSQWLQIPTHKALIKKVKNTPNQRGLSSTARRQNIKNAFKIDRTFLDYGYRTVALVDDVITTGSTLNEIAKALQKVGVEHIQVWGVART